jgi:polyhydroxyalkanoate synthesis regulator protein
MDETKLLELIEKAVHIGERYGVASLQNDIDSMNRIKDDYDRLREDIRKLLRPPAWGAGMLAGQHYRTATEVMMRQQQMMQQAMSPPLTKATLQAAYDKLSPPKEEPDIEIEFSL